MKLWEIFRFEIIYQLRRTSIWIYFMAILGLSFLSTMEFVDNARSGEFFLNAPIVLAVIAALSSLFGLLIIAAVTGDAATRDVRARMEPLLFTTPLDKLSYLGGRFFAAFTVSLIVLVAVPFGLVAAAQMPEVETVFFGPFRPAAFLRSYTLLALPNIMVATSLLFSLALLSRQAMASYFGGAFLFVAALFSKDILAGGLGLWEIGKHLDPSGITVLSELRKVWTPLQKNAQLIELEGSLLSNRLLWLGVGLGALAITCFRFQFTQHAQGSRRRSILRQQPISPLVKWSSPIVVPSIDRTFNLVTRAYQMKALALDAFRTVVASRGFRAIIPTLVLLLFVVIPELLEGPLGVPSLPTTGRVTTLFGHFFIEFIVVAVITIYAGQLVWREREARMSDISDTVPVPDFVWLLGKLLGLLLMLLMLQALFIATGMLIQAAHNYYEFEIGLYLRVLFGFQLIDYLLFTILALTVHVLVNQKYMGHTLVLIAYLFTVYANQVGIEHKLLIWGSDLGLGYSDFRGFGPLVAPWIWFKLYWTGWALLLVVVGRLFWVRGRETGFGWRIRLTRLRFTRYTQAVVIVAVMLVFTVGAFIFYNTNVLNDYLFSAEKKERHAEYELRYGQFKGVPQPRLAGTRLYVDVFPDRRELTLRGIYRLENKSRVAIDSIHLTTSSEVSTAAVNFDLQAREVISDQKIGYRIYVLEQPLLPGDTLQLSFELHFQPHGFSNSGINTAVAGNGTHVLNQKWLPAIGYQPERELDNTADRRKFGLSPRPATPSLYDEEARQNLLGREQIQFEATIGTAGDQIALAPGVLHQMWTEKDRRYFHYITDVPIRNIYPLVSARYAVHEAMWRNTPIQIYHHPLHTQNLERMVRAASASLDYYSRQFGPYPHPQLNLVEFPGSVSKASAFPGMISYSEGFALLRPEHDERGFDFPFAVLAHEVAHQWWAHQLVPANVEGAPLLAESLAWYSAMGVVEETYGREHLQRLLQIMREQYLSPRTRASVPLLRATDNFLAYRKGPFAMYALREYVGEKQVSTALRRLLEKHGAGEPPLPTSLELYRELQLVTPDSLQYLLTDLFETNTFWELKTEEVRAEPKGSGSWEVTLDVVARKVQVDSAGIETEIPMDDLVEIGVFANAEKGAPEEQLYIHKHRIHSGRQQITIIVQQEPLRAGIDPQHLLIDIKVSDNVKKVIKSFSL